MEAVGLVIGVIPLAVSALDTYRTILSSMKNAQRDLAFMSRDLRTEHQILQNTCEILLRGIATESELDLLLEDPFGPQWRRYDEQVRLRLWRSAYVFQERVDEMGQAALDLQQKLAIEKTAPGKTKLRDRGSILQELKHGAYFTLKKKDYTSILARLKDGNAVLNTLANQNTELEPTRRSRSQAKIATLMRKLSKSVYSALKNVMTCHCSPPHGLGLEMKPSNHVILPGDEEDTAARSLDFSLMVGTYFQNNGQRWDRVRVQMTEHGVGPPTPPFDQTDLPKAKSRKIYWSSSAASTRTKPSHSLASSTSDQAVADVATVVQTGSVAQPLAITDLCDALRKGKGTAATPSCYGTISSTAKQFNVYHVHSHCQPEDSCVVTLRSILEGQVCDLNQFTYLERLKVALALSYGTLHLHNTPWIPKTLKLDDVGFLGEQQTPGSHSYCLDRPFLAKALVQSPTSCYPQPVALLRRIDLNVLSLGLLLIQIIVGRYIPDLVITKDMSLDAILSKQTQAEQMTARVMENGGINYARAVEWCLKSMFSASGLEDDTFGQEFHEAVISRLENDLRFQATPMPD